MTCDESLALYSEGKTAWNKWAEHLLGRKRLLQQKGTWKIRSRAFGDGGNVVTKKWLEAARVDFLGLRFDSVADFSGFLFPFDVVFGSPCHLMESSISVETDYRSAAFAKEVKFNEAMFFGDAYFCNCAFFGCVDFSDVHFKQYAWFNKTQFSKKLILTDCHFATADELFGSLKVSFEGARFKRNKPTLNEQYPHAEVFAGAQFCRSSRNPLQWLNRLLLK